MSNAQDVSKRDQTREAFFRLVRRKRCQTSAVIMVKSRESGYILRWVVCRWDKGRGGEENGEMSVQSMGETGKVFCPNFLQPFLENIGRRSCNDGSREPIPVFHNPHRKCRPSFLAVARTL